MTFIPRPARLVVRIDGVNALQIKLENQVARILVRIIRRAQDRWSLSDEATADVIIAALVHELEAQE